MLIIQIAGFCYTPAPTDHREWPVLCPPASSIWHIWSLSPLWYMFFTWLPEHQPPLVFLLPLWLFLLSLLCLILLFFQASLCWRVRIQFCPPFSLSKFISLGGSHPIFSFKSHLCQWLRFLSAAPTQLSNSTHASNCLLAISTWMSNKYHTLNIS